jgi:thioredoxin reductase (NADPH)
MGLRWGAQKMGGGVIWQGIRFETPVIPAKAGIQSFDNVFPKAFRVDSRFRGNDCGFERPCLANDTSTKTCCTKSLPGSKIGDCRQAAKYGRRVAMRNVVIMGSGCAGLTAAIYAARANLKPLVIRGLEAGGQLTLTTLVENFPGFPKGVQGPELIERMQNQAAEFGAEFMEGYVIAADLSIRPFVIDLGSETVEARTLIVASGASAKLLGLESERKLLGHGVSTCATCDGYFYRGKEVVVVGGGDTAAEEALFLTRYAAHVSIIHRRDQLRASKIMQDRLYRNPKINFIWDSLVADVLDVNRGEVTGIRLKNIKTGGETMKSCDGVFMGIGHSPNTSLFRGQLEMNEVGYLITHDGSKTNVPGVFAAGDVQDHVYRQAITAAGSGCMAAIDAERFLEAEH